MTMKSVAAAADGGGGDGGSVKRCRRATMGPDPARHSLAAAATDIARLCPIIAPTALCALRIRDKSRYVVVVVTK